MKYFPDLTKAEHKAIADFLRGQKYVTEVQIDNFMRESYKKFGLFENCVAHVTNKDLVIKRPIGWSTKEEE